MSATFKGGVTFRELRFGKRRLWGGLITSLIATNCGNVSESHNRDYGRIQELPGYIFCRLKANGAEKKGLLSFLFGEEAKLLQNRGKYPCVFRSKISVLLGIYVGRGGGSTSKSGEGRSLQARPFSPVCYGRRTKSTSGISK